MKTLNNIQPPRFNQSHIIFATAYKSMNCKNINIILTLPPIFYFKHTLPIPPHPHL